MKKQNIKLIICWGYQLKVNKNLKYNDLYLKIYQDDEQITTKNRIYKTNVEELKKI